MQISEWPSDVPKKRSTSMCTMLPAIFCRCSTVAVTRYIPVGRVVTPTTKPAGSNRASRATGLAAPRWVMATLLPPDTYLHDVHGNMMRMPHIGGGSQGPNMHWDYKEQLRQT